MKKLINKIKNIYYEIKFFVIPEDKELLKKQLFSVYLMYTVIIISLVVAFLNV